MVGWSSLKQLLKFNQLKSTVKSHRLMSDHRTFFITPSRWQWHKFKDYLHYYVLVGLIPVGGIVFYSNVFIGPATLTEIPEGYVPKHWEYYRNPIQRFFARYIYASHQQEYEKFLHLTFEEEEKMKLRKLQKEVYDKMGTRGDYQAYFYRSLTDVAKNRRMNYEYDEERRTVMGDNVFDEV